MPDFDTPFMMGGRVGVTCENMDTFELARKRARYGFDKGRAGLLVLNMTITGMKCGCRNMYTCIAGQSDCARGGLVRPPYL